nr:MAG TPA: hypothetical protein [Caudoviricetes sp.]
MRINDGNIWKKPALDSPVGNGGRLQLRQPRGDDITLPWQPPGGQAVVKGVQQPTQSDNPAGGSSNGVAESYMENWTAHDGNKRFGNAQSPEASANQGSGNQGGSLVQGNLSTADIPRTLDPEFSFGPGKTPGADTAPVNPPAGGQPQPGFGGTTIPPTGGAVNRDPLDPSIGVSPGGAGGDIDPGFTPGNKTSTGTDVGAVVGAGSSAGGGTIYDWYRKYLNQLGDYKTPSATSQEEMIRKMYEASLAANKSQLESDYNQNLSDLGAEEGKLGSIYYEQQRQAQAEADRNRQAFQEYANARGLNSGTGGQAELAQQNQLAANMNNLRQSEAEKRAEIERQRQLLGQQYQSAIQKAQADNDLNLAKALYEEAVRVDESLTSAAKADADRALQMFNILNSSVMSSAGSNASAYAELLGISGGNTEQLNEMYNKAQQIVSSGGYYGKSSSGGSSFKQATQDEIEWAEYYINIINKAGGIDNVENYLATNYKSYGIPYQKVSKTTASMAKTARGYSTNKYVIGSEKGKGIAGNLQVGNKYYASDGSVWRKSPNGKVYVTKDGVEMEADIKG